MQTVLIVDDDEYIRAVSQAMLQPAYRVLLASNGVEALESVHRERPDLILLDIVMPVLNGFETCQQLKAGEFADIPVIFVSALDGPEDKLRGYAAGADDYLPKSSDPQEMLARIERHLRQARTHKTQSLAADEARNTAMTAMTSMGELGVLLQAMRRLVGCGNLDAIAGGIVDSCAEYGLAAAVRLSLPHAKAFRASDGHVTKMLMSAIEQVATMERIVEFNTCLGINYQHVTLIIRNMPADAERRGRYRDHLASLVEAANERVEAIDRDQIIDHSAAEVLATLTDIDEEQRQIRGSSNFALEEMLLEFDRACASLLLTEGQEHDLMQLMQRNVNKLRQVLSVKSHAQSRLTRLSSQIRERHGVPASGNGAAAAPAASRPAVASQAVTLFD